MCACARVCIFFFFVGRGVRPVSAGCLFFCIHDCDSVTHEEYKVYFFDIVLILLREVLCRHPRIFFYF